MKIQGTNFLITGGSGFLGHHVVNDLLQKEAEVTLLIQPHEKTWRLSEIRGKYNICNASLSCIDSVQKALAQIRPTVVIHFAGLMERKRDITLLNDLYQHHLHNTVNLIQSADSDVTKLIINTGTSEEYGEQSDPFTELIPSDPVSPYSASKAAATAAAAYLSRKTGIPIITMRPFLCFGPGQIHDTLIPFLIKGILQKKNIELTEGLQYRDFIYVKDLVSCYLCVVENLEFFVGPQIFNVGSGKPRQIKEVFSNISFLLKGEQYLNIGARTMRAGEPRSMIADISKARTLLGWEPETALLEGLEKTIAWWHIHEELWRD